MHGSILCGMCALVMPSGLGIIANMSHHLSNDTSSLQCASSPSLSKWVTDKPAVAAEVPHGVLLSAIGVPEGKCSRVVGRKLAVLEQVSFNGLAKIGFHHYAKNAQRALNNLKSGQWRTNRPKTNHWAEFELRGGSVADPGRATPVDPSHPRVHVYIPQ
jgi:hypothetical protein